jgi:hypothetical protein
MSKGQNVNEQVWEGDPADQQVSGERETPFQQLLRLQGDIEEQGQRVIRVIDKAAEAHGKNGNISLEIMDHVKAQILKAHLQLDDLEQLFDQLQ